MSGYIVEDHKNTPEQGEGLLVRSLPLTDMTSNVPFFGRSVNFKHMRNPVLDALIRRLLPVILHC